MNSPTTCGPENIHFVGDYSDSVDVSFTIGGNSIPGVDYVGLQSGTVTIPAGEWCVDIPYSIITDTIPEWTFEYDAGPGEYVPEWATNITMTMTGYASHGDWSKVYELDPPSSGRFKASIADDDEYPVPPERPTCDCGSERVASAKPFVTRPVASHAPRGAAGVRPQIGGRNERGAVGTAVTESLSYSYYSSGDCRSVFRIQQRSSGN